jgi:hypothetical protein
METHNAIIERNENSAILIFNISTVTLSIPLTEDRPNDVKEVFNQLLIILKKGLFALKLADTKEDLYHHICQEYIKHLNNELEITFQELKDYGLID